VAGGTLRCMAGSLRVSARMACGESSVKSGKSTSLELGLLLFFADETAALLLLLLALLLFLLSFLSSLFC